jgi:hypothetical protein
MPSKKLMGFWAFFDLLVLVAGVLSIAFSLVWHSPNNALRSLVITDTDMTGESMAAQRPQMSA